MLLNKIAGDNSKIIIEKYLEWIDSGCSTSEILVLANNSTSKKNIIQGIYKNAEKYSLTDIKISTFNGLIRSSVADNWCILENMISDRKSKITPNLSGLEVSQYILKQIIKNDEVKGYNSKKSLLHQIFRRYSLIVNNNLSSEDVIRKSKILGESFGEDANNIIQKYKAKTVDLRAFDYIRQAQIFSYIYKNTDYFKNIKYLVIEDGDEVTPLCIDFVKQISNQLKDKLIILDKDGGTRIGYLCADTNAPDEFEKIFDEKFTDDIKENINVKILYENIFKNERKTFNNMKIFSLSKRADMVDSAISYTNELIKKGIKPSEISIISPIQDKMLKYLLSDGLKNCEPIFLSGNEKLVDNQLVRAIMTILKLSVNLETDEYELRVLLSKYLGIPIKNCKKIFEQYNNLKTLEYVDIGKYSDEYKKLCTLIEEIKNKNLLSEKAYAVYLEIVRKVDKNDINKFNFFIKELQDFENVFQYEIKDKESEILTQLENSIISENPYSTLELSEKNIVIGTPQKIIDNKIKTKYQLWLDVSSLEWTKEDTGPLYNSWVFQNSWKKQEYTIEDNIELSKLKIYKILRKLIINTDNIGVFSSLFDTQGTENFGGIEKYLVSEKNTRTEKQKSSFNIIPRKDQQPVLEYKSGKMAISAVPGAGKTTILLALIIELMNKGINPDNIFVLTYMESAARNFKDRIKSLNIANNKIPNISTIHGLALRILKENANYERIGLDADFEICDDTKRNSILKSLSENISKQDVEDFERAVSVLKLSGTEINPDKNPEIERLLILKKGVYSDMKLSRFLKFFYNYQYKLSEEGLIDYDDILISSVRLLEDNKDILNYYQNICEYIIEDEAQDSSSIQQKLLNLLSAKHNNIIRCGDINQAITATFTNADVKGFKKYIENSNRVDMNCSQRCSEGVWKLANKLVEYGNKNYDEPFYEIFMQPVVGKNPQEKIPVCSNIYSNIAEEKLETLKEIRTILYKNPKATIGILLRNNYQVNIWADYINNSGLTAITRNECLGQKKLFKVIFSILKFISNPYDNKTTANAYRALAECGILKPHLDKVIESFETDFIVQDNDNISDSDLSRFHWDMNYWLSFPELPIDELAIRIGLTYFSGYLEKSNIFLISTLCSKLNSGNFSQTVQRLEELSVRPSLSGFKFFSEDEEQDLIQGKIQIMTLHKSKGDEFDYVFLPEMSEKNITLNPDKLKLKRNSDFLENVRGLSRSYRIKTEDEMKKFLVDENYKLLYVAITRARKRLYISVSQKEMYYGKEKNIEQCSEIFELTSEYQKSL